MAGNLELSSWTEPGQLSLSWPPSSGGGQDIPWHRPPGLYSVLFLTISLSEMARSALLTISPKPGKVPGLKQKEQPKSLQKTLEEGILQNPGGPRGAARAASFPCPTGRGKGLLCDAWVKGATEPLRLHQEEARAGSPDLPPKAPHRP